MTDLIFSRDFGFGIPVLPYIAGRELVGQVIRTSVSTTRFQEGDQVRQTDIPDYPEYEH